jgi:D-galactarolactone isomerase
MTDSDPSESHASHAVAPPDACDAHIHILDPAFPALTQGAHFAEGATAADYAMTRRALGTARTVVVQSKTYGTDNSCLLDGIARLMPARGIAVVHSNVSDAELKRLHKGGVRGIRFSLWNPEDAVVTFDMIAPLARRITGLGWHVQIHMSGDQIVECEGMLRTLPCPIAIDHMGRLPPELGVRHDGYSAILRLLDRGRTWVKLSGAYLNTAAGVRNFADASAVACALVKAAPERLVWGSDWPHVTEHDKPDTATLLKLLTGWTDNKLTRSRILVENPAELYGFEQGCLNLEAH